ncbi:hypothetical protein [Demetria terragena]|uniref:hypothetical protein n=1 Tax=Demetria terragena TaxID=63959 RepID=UPI0003A3A18B|nr:hypothetical protein [Demetria terragena]
MAQEGASKVAWNAGGAIVGIVLAALAVFGLVQSQSSVQQKQTYSETISYDN